MKEQDRREVYRALIEPGSIAVIGASNDPFKPGGRVTKNIKEHGFKGDLWAVNSKASSVMGLPTFRSIDHLPAAPDLSIIAIPAPGVQAALKELAEKGAKATIILTAGFGEKDEKGKEEERRLLDIAGKAGMTLIGPNCSGFLTPVYAGKFAGIIPRLKERSVDFISGSGATVDYVMEQATSRGLSFSTVVNLGNSIQMGVEDLLELFDENYGPRSSPILMLYMEQVREPGKLLRHSRNLSRKGCSIIGIKSGVTAEGGRAAESHTGAMATDDTAVQALFEKGGIIRVRSKAELIDVACILASGNSKIGGTRVCIITDAGGPGVMLSDELATQGLELVRFRSRTLERLSEILPPESSITNPIDCLPSRTAQQIGALFKVLEQEERDNIDVIVVITGNSGMSDNRDIYDEIGKAMDTCEVPVIPVLSPVTTCAALMEEFRDKGHSYFTDEVAAGRALGTVVKRPVTYEAARIAGDYDKARLEQILGSAPRVLGPDAEKGLLMAAGFKFPAQVEVCDRNDLKDACEKVGFPLVMKALGPMHKSDVGGVRVGIRNGEEATGVWEELMAVKGVSGVIVQRMVEGTEVIIGAKKEEGFGHLIMFGLGGIYTEVLKDITFALAPLAREEAMGMVQRIKAFPIIQGARGQKGLSLETLSEYLVRIGQLVSDFPQIREIDLNPVKGYGEDLFVVDARIVQG
ncbi:MAG: acetate--CoA ligase family protein, partial [Deltaproteobacteria bacterium]|nr:acetate--CoA ligase family protein [Deltaproteobacteria bacterium]